MSTDLLRQLGLDTHERVVLEPVGDETPERGIVLSENPATGRPIAGVRLDTADTYEKTIALAAAAFKAGARSPPPSEGQVVRAIGDELRKNLEPLGELVALEVGKIRQPRASARSRRPSTSPTSPWASPASSTA